MSSEISRKHSLWLSAPDLQPVVNELAKEATNPTFTPHLTLIGNFQGTMQEAMDIARKIAQTFNNALTVKFSGFGTQNEEFRYFCLLAEKSQELDELYKYVHQFYAPAASETFRNWPHISLLYGTESARLAFSDTRKLQARYATTLEGARTFGYIEVLESEGGVTDWCSVGTVALEGSSPLQ